MIARRYPYLAFVVTTVMTVPRLVPNTRFHPTLLRCDVDTFHVDVVALLLLQRGTFPIYGVVPF